MRNVSDESSRGNHNIVSIFFSRRAVYEIVWKNIVEAVRPQMTVWRMLIACWIPKATDTHSEYVILIAFRLRQRFHERASMLRYTYIACLVYSLLERRAVSRIMISERRLPAILGEVYRRFL